MYYTLSNGEQILFMPQEYGEWDNNEERAAMLTKAVAKLRSQLALLVEDLSDAEKMAGAI